jgi:hypothetical protein
MAGFFTTFIGWTRNWLRPPELSADRHDLNLPDTFRQPGHHIEQGALPWEAEQRLSAGQLRVQRHQHWRSGPWQLK